MAYNRRSYDGGNTGALWKFLAGMNGGLRGTTGIAATPVSMDGNSITLDVGNGQGVTYKRPGFWKNLLSQGAASENYDALANQLALQAQNQNYNRNERIEGQNYKTSEREAGQQFNTDRDATRYKHEDDASALAHTRATEYENLRHTNTLEQNREQANNAIASREGFLTRPENFNSYNNATAPNISKAATTKGNAYIAALESAIAGDKANQIEMDQRANFLSKTPSYIGDVMNNKLALSNAGLGRELNTPYWNRTISNDIGNETTLNYMPDGSVIGGLSKVSDQAKTAAAMGGGNSQAAPNDFKFVPKSNTSAQPVVTQPNLTQPVVQLNDGLLDSTKYTLPMLPQPVQRDTLQPITDSLNPTFIQEYNQDDSMLTTPEIGSLEELIRKNKRN